MHCVLSFQFHIELLFEAFVASLDRAKLPGSSYSLLQFIKIPFVDSMTYVEAFVASVDRLKLPGSSSSLLQFIKIPFVDSKTYVQVLATLANVQCLDFPSLRQRLFCLSIMCLSVQLCVSLVLLVLFRLTLVLHLMTLF